VVKSAILGALAVMIDKGGVALKPFVPQLQVGIDGKCSPRHGIPLNSIF
jgi:hypothetical protein